MGVRPGGQDGGSSPAQRPTQKATAQRVIADRVLVSRAGPGLPPSVARAAAKLPGVSATGIVSTDVFVLDHGLDNQGDSWEAAGLDPAGARGTIDLRGALRVA